MEKYEGTPFLTLALIFIIVGLLLYFFHPKKVNSLIGYRTSASMKSDQHWVFAQKYSSKILLVGGVAQLLAYSISIVFPDNSYLDYIGIVLLFITIATVFFKTESELKKL